MELQRPTAQIRSIRRRAVMQQAMPKQTTSRLERHHHLSVYGNMCVADLPITSVEMHHRTLSMRTGDNVHTPIFGSGFIQCNPSSDDRCI